MTDAPTIPDMKPVESSNLESVGYDPAAKAMFIRFKSGGLYRYADVPPETHAAFMAAPSKGRHFKAAFAGKFTHQKVNG